MEVICSSTACTGCMACSNICPKNAITFKPNEEGFLHPVIDSDLCIDCQLCKKVCPVNAPVMKKKTIKVFSGWSADEQIRLSSSSGGAFSEIAIAILNQNGVVFGAMLNSDLKVVHSYVENREDLSKLRGSKYVQSFIGESYTLAKTFLQKGRKVLFTGTPCQIAGLYNYLRKDYDNLYTMDLVCHGVPSPMIFEKYKAYLEKEQNFKIQSIKFRDKKYSWTYFNQKIEGVDNNTNERKSYIGTYYHDPYLRGFLRDYFIRPNCHSCVYTSPERVSDFTVADWWNYTGESPIDKGFQRKGVSLILCCSSKSVDLLPQLNLVLKERTLSEAINTNMPLRSSFHPNKDRDAFWYDFKHSSFESLVKKYMSPEKTYLFCYLSSKYQNKGAMSFIISTCKLFYRINNRLKKIKLIGSH